MAEGAGFENRFVRKCDVGSNPTLSVIGGFGRVHRPGLNMTERSAEGWVHQGVGLLVAGSLSWQRPSVPD